MLKIKRRRGHFFVIPVKDGVYVLIGIQDKVVAAIYHYNFSDMRLLGH